MEERFVSFQSHADHIALLNRLKNATEYIQLVQIDNDKNDPVIVTALNRMELIQAKKVNRWLGTRRGGAGVVQYTFRKSDSFWRYLAGFDAFFLAGRDRRGCDTVSRTAFGLRAIAFLDKEMRVMFFTVTHAGAAVEYVE